MKQKITRTLNNCENCKTQKFDRNPPKPQFEMPEIPGKPMQILHIDVYSINNRQVLTIIDKFSKFGAAYPLETRNSVSILKAFKNYISLYGIPQKVVCDQGTEFTANIFKDFCNQYKIELHFTSFQQSSSNSPVERLHSTITEIYRLILLKRKEHNMTLEHEEILTEALITYNNAIHSSTGHTPYELFFGRPYKFYKETNTFSQHEYLDKLNEFLNKLYPDIKEKVQEITRRRIDNLNESKEIPENHEENDVVFRKEARRNKLTPRFSKHIIAKNNKVTILTRESKKIHKSKVRRIQRRK